MNSNKLFDQFNNYKNKIFWELKNPVHQISDHAASNQRTLRKQLVSSLSFPLHNDASSTKVSEWYSFPGLEIWVITSDFVGKITTSEKDMN